MRPQNEDVLLLATWPLNFGDPETVCAAHCILIARGHHDAWRMRDESQLLALHCKMSATNTRSRATKSLAAHERAAAFRQRAERLIGRDGGAHLEVVPWALRFRRLLHLDQVHRVDLAAVGTHRAPAE